MNRRGLVKRKHWFYTESIVEYFMTKSSNYRSALTDLTRSNQDGNAKIPYMYISCRDTYFYDVIVISTCAASMKICQSITVGIGKWLYLLGRVAVLIGKFEWTSVQPWYLRCRSVWLIPATVRNILVLWEFSVHNTEETLPLCQLLVHAL